MFQEFNLNFQEFKDNLMKLPVCFTGDFRAKPYRVVVLGGVGVGKSSLIERLIGEESFKLPKGLNSCTRRPVIIDPSKIDDNSKISDVKISTTEPLILCESSESIELIDLPGLTEMARPDQPSNYAQITQNVFDFFAKTADIILLCLPADMDFCNSDSLRRLRELGIEDGRIIGVISKVDLVEDPEVIDLEIAETFDSVVLIRNAPNLEINDSIKTVNDKETEYFQSFKCRHSTGIVSLRNKLLTGLWRQFESEKSEAKVKLSKIQARLRDRLGYLQDPNIELNILLNYINRVKLELDFNSSTRQSRLDVLFWTILPETIERINPFEGINREGLGILLRNSKGLRSNSTGIESALKFLVKEQLTLSNRVIEEFLVKVMQEIQEILLVWSDDEFELIGEEESFEEFYDVRSVSECEIEFNDEESGDQVQVNFDDEIRLIPGLRNMINESLSSIIKAAYETTHKYLKEYCAMQRELIFCRDSKYLEVLNEYDRRMKRQSSLVLSRTTSKQLIIDSIDDEDSTVPMTRINSDSFENLNFKNSGIIRELIDLIFPSGDKSRMKRVEYRPRIPKFSQKEQLGLSGSNKSNHVNGNDCNINKNINTYDDSNEIELILKLLEIYLNSYHLQLMEFVPKCINYHLIQQIIQRLPTILLKATNNKNNMNEIEKEIVKIKKILEISERVKSG